ncbi:MAG: spore coat protein CotH [Lachnospiraceae bacterium]|nr:spore coat protein CotH [Lachnospiraceae bacterium]
MSTHKHIDKICCVIVALSLVVTLLFMNGEKLGIVASAKSIGYENRLFDFERVHTIDVVMDDWDSFIETCENEEYAECSVVIDGEAYKNVGIRAKGNTSLSTVSQMDSERYSFKIEFDQYDSTKSYYGLDKLSLNNIIQDNSYMKDFLVYRLMEDFGVAAPLCSYVYITVNGEDWGLYLAVEGVEDAFLQRNYGNDYGELYKPDSLSFGGGRGNGMDFNMEDFDFGSDRWNKVDTSLSDKMNLDGNMPGGMGSSDVKLQYIDDEYDSYSNIFDNAKTDITDADKTRLIDALEALCSGENIESVVDIDVVLRYFVVHNFVVNGDSYTGSMVHNYYLYEEGGQLSMIPWDYNLAYGTFQRSDATGTVNEPIDSPVSGGSTDDRPMVAWIFESEEYAESYHQYFAEFIEKYFDSGYVEELIENTAEMIAPYVEKDPTKFCTYEEFETGVETIKQFCLLRAESVSGQLEGIIPSTSEGQSEDSSTLVDASMITISDMGTMSNTMGMGGRGQKLDMSDFGSGMEFPENMELPEGMELPSMPDMSGMEEGATASEDMAEKFPGFSEQQQSGRPSMDNMGGMQIPGESTEFPGNNAVIQENSATNTNALILVGVSLVVLLVGLIVVFKYKR